jgi:hypothetical protein
VAGGLVPAVRSAAHTKIINMAQVTQTGNEKADRAVLVMWHGTEKVKRYLEEA